MSIYSEPISEAINETDPEILKEVEKIMRENIFHSTLDWQDKKTFDDGAREAYEFYKNLRADSSDKAGGDKKAPGES